MNDKPHVNNPAVTAESQKTFTDRYIELFQLDLSQFDRGIFCFTTSYPDEIGKTVKFNNREYLSVPIIAEGFEWNGQGQAPRPKLTLSTINPITSAMIVNYNDLIYCTVTRIRTFERFLDDGDTPDPLAKFQEDIFKIERKSKLSMYSAEFELASVIDQEGQYLPKNQVLKYHCSFIYRVYDGEKFLIDLHNPCPYNGTRYYDKKNQNYAFPVKDSCSKTIDGCRVRFNEPGQILPFQGFPGVKRG